MPRPRIAHRLLALAATLLASACSTEFAEIAGPRIGLGLEIDHDLHVSARLELGLDYDKWNNALGYGGSVAVAWAPEAGRVEALVEGRAFVLVLFGVAPLTPFGLGAVVAWSRAEGATLGVRAGLGTLMYMPPSACVRPLEGDTKPCPPELPTLDDVIERPWLPRIDYRASFLWSLEGRRDKAGETRLSIVHLLAFELTKGLR
ncbi:MAG: hypothetical protein U1F43_00950 [Myxococcota bacterium]